jgi:SPP1 gp7 family putative phage head morphogenesis protein
VKKLFNNSMKKLIKTETDFFGVELDEEKLLKTKWGEDNLNWEKRLDNQINQQKNKIKNRLKLGFIRQDYITDINDDLLDEFKKFNKQLWSLYETEINATTSLARLEVLSKLGYKKYQYYARFDERTCGSCGHMHGTKFPISQFQIGVTAPPMHPHCRCWVTNIRD